MSSNKYAYYGKWLAIATTASATFVFLPRVEVLGYGRALVYEYPSYGLIYDIYGKQGELLGPEVVINVLCGLLLVVLVWVFSKLALKFLPAKRAGILLAVALALFLFFPGYEEGRDYSKNCGDVNLTSASSTFCAGEPIRVRTFGLLGDTFAHEYAQPEKALRPNLPVVYWNAVAAVLTAICIVPVYFVVRKRSHHSESSPL